MLRIVFDTRQSRWVRSYVGSSQPDTAKLEVREHHVGLRRRVRCVIPDQLHFEATSAGTTHERPKRAAASAGVPRPARAKVIWFYRSARLQQPLPKAIFNGERLVVSYLTIVRTAKETIMTVIASGSASAVNQTEWISCSHWGMFPVRRKTRVARK